MKKYFVDSNYCITFVIQNKTIMKTYIAYYRVSTTKQGDSGLGLASQKDYVNRFIPTPGQLINEYTEVESGRKNTRPKLLEAIEECKRTNSTLVIAKLDRLSRNAAFVLTLRDSGVDFICSDIPEANTLTIGLLAIIAEEEAKKGSERTTAALREIKKNINQNGFHVSKSGTRITSLGNPQNLSKEAIDKSKAVRIEKAKNNPESKKAGAYIVSLKDNGESFAVITNKVSESGFKAPKGGMITQTQVKRLYNRYKVN